MSCDPQTRVSPETEPDWWGDQENQKILDSEDVCDTFYELSYDPSDAPPDNLRTICRVIKEHFGCSYKDVYLYR